MKSILDWPKQKKSQPRLSAELDQTTDDNEYTIEMSCGADMPDLPGTRGAEREVVMPDIYGEKHEATEPPLKILDPNSPDIDKSTGFDPYDTVVLHEKKG